MNLELEKLINETKEKLTREEKIQSELILLKKELKTMLKEYENIQQNGNSPKVIREMVKNIRIKKGEITLKNKELNEERLLNNVSVLVSQIVNDADYLKSLDQEIAIGIELAIGANDDKKVKMVDQFGKEIEIVEYMADDLKDLINKRVKNYNDLLINSNNLASLEKINLNLPASNFEKEPYSLDDNKKEEQFLESTKDVSEDFEQIDFETAQKSLAEAKENIEIDSNLEVEENFMNLNSKKEIAAAIKTAVLKMPSAHLLEKYRTLNEDVQLLLKNNDLRNLKGDEYFKTLGNNYFECDNWNDEKLEEEISSLEFEKADLSKLWKDKFSNNLEKLNIKDKLKTNILQPVQEKINEVKKAVPIKITKVRKAKDKLINWLDKNKVKITLAFMGSVLLSYIAINALNTTIKKGEIENLENINLPISEVNEGLANLTGNVSNSLADITKTADSSNDADSEYKYNLDDNANIYESVSDAFNGENAKSPIYPNDDYKVTKVHYQMPDKTIVSLDTSSENFLIEEAKLLQSGATREVADVLVEHGQNADITGRVTFDDLEFVDNFSTNESGPRL